MRKMIKMNGFNLIDVLIGMLLLSFILLGFDAMEIFAFQKNRNAYLLSIAENQMNSIIERLHALNKNSGLSTQLAIWNRQNQEMLPQGRGKITGQYPHYSIAIFWGNLGESCNKNQIGMRGCIHEDIQL